MVAAEGSADRDRDVASLLASLSEAGGLGCGVRRGRRARWCFGRVRACLVHEMALRGVAVTEVPGIARWARTPIGVTTRWAALEFCPGLIRKQYVQTDLEADRQVANTLAELIIGGTPASLQVGTSHGAA